MLNWEGEAGGRGIRALTRYIYQPPALDNLTALNDIYSKMTGFFMVGFYNYPHALLILLFLSNLTPVGNKAIKDVMFGSGS